MYDAEKSQFIAVFEGIPGVNNGQILRYKKKLPGMGKTQVRINNVLHLIADNLYALQKDIDASMTKADEIVQNLYDNDDLE